MRSRFTNPFSFRVALVCTAVALLPRSAPAQVPSQAEVQRLLANPQASEAIRQRILRSGLTPDQIRARLQAAGLSPALLDEYLPGRPGAEVSPSESVVRAVELLGLGAADELQAYATSIRREALLGQAAAPDDGSGLRLFGLDVFRRPTTQFLPPLAGPVDANYRLGPGDVLVLIVTGDVELAHTLEVTREGFVVIPQVGQVPVANLTMDQLRRLLRQRLARSYSGIPAGTTRFEVTVAQVRMIQVYVIGEVARPGSYQIPSVSTVVTALYEGGGPTERGNFRSVAVRRGRDTVAAFDLYDYLLEGTAAGDVRLETGDVVFVPVHGTRVAVTGAVVRPAIYELERGETLEDVLLAAGGFRADAQLERVAVHRVLSAGERGPGPAYRAAIDVPLRAGAGRGEVSDGRDGSAGGLAGVVVPRLAMEDGDSVVVDWVGRLTESLFVRIAGMVQKPGTYPWREGITLRDLVFLARGPTLGADLREAEVARLPAERDGGQLAVTLRVPLDSSYLFLRDSLGGYRGAAGVAFAAAGSAPDVPLEPFDQVTILKQPEFELQRLVDITGEVRFPGSYALTRKDERLSNLVARAGGLLPTAYPEGARFIRRLDNAGRVDIELARVLRDEGGRRDVVLQPGDSLHVPEYNPTVRVTGAVNSPTSVLYREGEGLGYYIENAGGYSNDADKGRVSVRYANGSARVRSKFLLFSSYPAPGPGSVVLVPEKRPGEPFNVTGFVASLAQIAASTVAIVVLVTRP